MSLLHVLETRVLISSVGLKVWFLSLLFVEIFFDLGYRNITYYISCLCDSICCNIWHTYVVSHVSLAPIEFLCIRQKNRVKPQTQLCVNCFSYTYLLNFHACLLLDFLNNKKLVLSPAFLGCSPLSSHLLLLSWDFERGNFQPPMYLFSMLWNTRA